MALGAQMTATPDDVPPPLTHAQARTIRAIGRRCGFPRDELEDLVQIVWLELKKSWAKCPRVEPRLSKYINGIARNTANGIIRKRRDDAMTGSTYFSSVDEATSTAPVNVTIQDKALAGQLVAKAASRDPEGAGWMVRTTMHGESFPQVSEDVGVAADTIRKRVARLLEWLREHAGVVSLVLFCVLAAGVSVLRAKPKSGPDSAQSATPQSLTPSQSAVLKRDAAFAACDVADWTRCAALLDEAAALDPAGERDARVRNARAAIASATRPAPGKPGTSLKPPR
jgi:DNA-directed RNA polymerase specialized sigma24 family protein